MLLHGAMGDSREWHLQLDGLADDFTVVAWDAPGCGGSFDPPGDFGLEGYADSLAAFISCLGLDTPHVMGLSFGSALALELFRRHPDLVRSLVLVSDESLHPGDPELEKPFLGGPHEGDPEAETAVVGMDGQAPDRPAPAVAAGDHRPDDGTLLLGDDQRSRRLLEEALHIDPTVLGGRMLGPANGPDGEDRIHVVVGGGADPHKSSAARRHSSSVGTSATRT